MILRLLLLTVLFTSFGCAFTTTEVGRPVAGTDGLVVGRTTKAEALARLGAPTLVQRQFDGDLYTWRRTLSRRSSITILPVYVKAFYYSSGESRRDALSLFFDADGVLQGVGLRRESEDPSGGLVP